MPARLSWRHDLARPMPERLRAPLVVALCFAVYSVNARVIPAADTRPARYLPFAVLRDHRLTLEGFAEEVQARVSPQVASHVVEGRVISVSPVIAPLAALPLYVPAYLYLDATGWNAAELGFLAALLEKVAASLLAALAMGGLYLLLRRRLQVGDALTLTIACAFGSTTWVISSQALWQHGVAQLVLVALLLAATAPPSPRSLGLAGAGAMLLTAARFPDVLLALPIAVFCLLRARGRGQRAAFLASASAMTGLLLWCNLAASGHLVGGSAFHAAFQTPATYLAHPLLAGLAGELLSPGKGLLVFSPWLLLGLTLRPHADGSGDRLLDALLGAGVAAQALLFARCDWLAGYCYGPRYLTDMLPALAWILAPALPGITGRRRLALWALIGWSIAVQAIGAFRYPSGHSDEVLYSSAAAPWHPGNAQFLLELKDACRVQGGGEAPLPHPGQVHERLQPAVQQLAGGRDLGADETEQRHDAEGQHAGDEVPVERHLARPVAGDQAEYRVQAAKYALRSSSPASLSSPRCKSVEGRACP